MANARDEYGLRDFAATGEGSPPPQFVVSEGVISDILTAAERALAAVAGVRRLEGPTPLHPAAGFSR